MSKLDNISGASWEITFFGIMLQTAVSHRSTDAGSFSLDAGLRMEVIPAMNLWNTIIDYIASPSWRRLHACSSTSHPKNIRNRFETLTIYLRTRDIQPNFTKHLRRQRSCNKASGSWPRLLHKIGFVSIVLTGVQQKSVNFVNNHCFF